MHIIDTFKSSIAALSANKARTFLTVLGIVIGIASVIIVFSAGAGINNLIIGQIEMFGTDIIETEIKVPTSKKGGAAEQQNAASIVQGVQITTLNLDDMEDIDELPNVARSYAGMMGQEQATYGSIRKKVIIYGVSATYIDIDQGEIGSGRFYTEAEDKSQAKVVVLGIKVKDKLFGDSDPIGKLVQLNRTKFRVIGVMKERGGVMGFDFDDLVYMPIITLQKRLLGVDYAQYFVHEVNDLSIVDETAEEIRSILRDNHNIVISGEESTGLWGEYGKDDFRVVTMAQMMETMDVITGAMTLLLLAIVAISLVVGGVGILNIMYVVVSERTQEIGLRKAVGAKYNDIMMQFLIESTIITTMGGIVGIVIGVLVSWLIAYVARNYGLEWDFLVPYRSYVVSLLFSVFFGIGFGLYPARKAASLDPIVALRKE